MPPIRLAGNECAKLDTKDGNDNFPKANKV